MTYQWIYDQIKKINDNNLHRFTIIGLLLFTCLLSIYYFHFILKTEVIFTHLFYVPIILASLWWARKGIAVAVFLSLLLLISHILSPLETPIWTDVARVTMFVIVSAVIAILNEKNLILLEKLRTYSETLEQQVEKRTSEILRTRKDLVNIFQAIGQQTMILDPQHTVISANRATVTALGRSEQELVGKKCYELIHGASSPPEGCPMEKMLTSGHFETTEMEVEALGGTYLVSCTPVFDEAGRLEKVIHIATDITERKKAEEELQQAYEKLKSLDRMKDEFLSNISHELKTPLVSIQGYSELLYDETIGTLNEQQKKAVNTVVRNSDRLRRLIDSLLYISLAEAEKVEYTFVPLHIDEVIDRSISEMLPQIEEKGLVLNKDVPDDLPLIKGDKDKLTCVLVNLICNATKFTSPGDEISIAVCEEEDDLKISVTDTGIGIPDEQIPALFNKFHQVDASVTRKHGGLGLGLYISKKIVEIHNGKIWVKSKEGIGTTVYVALPK